MKTKRGRDIKRNTGPGVDCKQCNHSDDMDREWLVPLHHGHAIIHRYRDGCDDQALCGPIIFCCHRAKQVFLTTFLISEFQQAEWSCVPASQIISWMEAGVQVIYYVYCAPNSDGGLLATGLSGKHAHQFLSGQSSEEDLPSGSIQILEQIANDTDQGVGETEDDLSPRLIIN